MTRQELLEDVCQTIGKYMSGDFPCFCGKNPIAQKEMHLSITQRDVENWEELKELILGSK